MPIGHNCEYPTFAACVAANQDKEHPEGYCAAIQAMTEEHCKKKGNASDQA